MAKEIGVGVIGLGMGKNMLAVNQDPSSRMEVRGLCDSNETLLRQVQRQHGVAFATTDYHALLTRPDIDVIGIYSPDHQHIEQVEAAARAGKHIICTKPMVVSPEEAVRTVAAVRQHKVKFLVGQTCRFTPAFMAAKKLYDDGDLGRPLFAEAHYVHDIRPVFDRTPWRYEHPQDMLYGGACHPIDLLRWFFGEVDEVFVYASQSGIDARSIKHDNFLINLRFTNGVIARVLAVFGLVEPPLPMLGLGIYGDKGSIVNDQLVLDKVPGQPVMKLSFGNEHGHGREVWRYMRHFEECLVEDKQPLINEVEGAGVIATAAACWESIRTGLPAKVQRIG
ncbi:MAG TPA: Gfo/Idh/MocA family oxidoreductase [Caldilineaceae bacterium]|nr:Gfo/Idh/MocA family oxidoreductase [Caldilineaceae bacterium]